VTWHPVKPKTHEAARINIYCITSEKRKEILEDSFPFFIPAHPAWYQQDTSHLSRRTSHPVRQTLTAKFPYPLRKNQANTDTAFLRKGILFPMGFCRPKYRNVWGQ
jgi:hypothetical protein